MVIRRGAGNAQKNATEENITLQEIKKMIINIEECYTDISTSMSREWGRIEERKKFEQDVEEAQSTK